MRRRDFIASAALATAFPRFAIAQQARKIPRVVLFHSGLPQVTIDVFLKGMRDSGYLPNRDFFWEIFEAPTIADLPKVGAAAIASKPDVLVTSGPSVYEAKAQTSTIPIVFFGVLDVVRGGLVESYPRPGGNATGVATPLLHGKWLELLKELIPGLARVAVFMVPGDPAPEALLPDVVAMAKTLGLEIIRVDAPPDSDLERDFGSAVARGAQASINLGNSTYRPRRQLFADLALKYRLPLASNRELVTAGGLLAYGLNPDSAPYRAASYVVDILKGAKPGALPVEEAVSFELIVNLKTAKALGIMIPPSVLYRATEFIE